jgi:hypothetical protein
MQQVQLEREIYNRAARCNDLLAQAAEAFHDYLEERIPANDPKYYRARNFLKEGKAYFDQTLQDARKLLGPIPIYASKDFEQWRAEILEENRIVLHGQDREALKTELMSDEFVKTLMGPEDISAYFEAGYESQKAGKRKLANFKVRLIIDRLAELLQDGQDLQKAAQRKQQGLPD